MKSGCSKRAKIQGKYREKSFSLAARHIVAIENVQLKNFFHAKAPDECLSHLQIISFPSQTAALAPYIIDFRRLLFVVPLDHFGLLNI